MQGVVVRALLTVMVVTMALAMPAYARDWWGAGEGRVFPAVADFPNEHGTLRVLLQDGPLDTRGHPFFEPLGPHGRACVTCHQPADAMSLSLASIRQQWQTAGARDPLFAPIDGANCPDLPHGERDSHSLLLDHGLFRIARPWPPRDHAGKAIKPDFDVDVIHDPTGCNLSPRWGLPSDDPHVSVYRRPRPVANLKYVLAMGFAIDGKRGLPLPLDPDTGKPVSGNLMADSRVLTLKAQMHDAARSHLGFFERLTPAQIERINDFEMRVFTAQQQNRLGDSLDAGGAEGGPAKLADSEPGRLGSQGIGVWSEFAPWERADDSSVTPERRALRESIARGARSFRERTFLIADSRGVNSPMGFGNPMRDRCALCHNMSQMGMDVAPGQVDLGTTTQPFADQQPHLPLFRITCKGEPHPHYGRVIHTHDPGYALTTGRCADVGRITLQSLRGLAARAPYFVNGTASTLREVVEYYDRRYSIGYTEQEIEDLVNLMSAL